MRLKGQPLRRPPQRTGIERSLAQRSWRSSDESLAAQRASRLASPRAGLSAGPDARSVSLPPGGVGDVVLNAVVGFAGLGVSIGALRIGTTPRAAAKGVALIAGRSGRAGRSRRSSLVRRSCRSTRSIARSTSASARNASRAPRRSTAFLLPRPTSVAPRAPAERWAVSGEDRKARPRGRDGRGGARAPDVEDGPEDHDRLLDADEQRASR